MPKRMSNHRHNKMSKRVHVWKGGARLKAAYHRAMGDSREVASGHAKCSAKAIQRWEGKGDADYWEHFEEARRRLKREGWSEAWRTLRKGLRSEDEVVRLRAASKIIDSVDRGELSRVDMAPSGEVRTFVVELPELHLPADQEDEGERD